MDRRIVLWRALAFLLLVLGAEPDLRAVVATQTIKLPYINDYLWDATRSRVFASAGNAILLINPETAQIEDTIASGVQAVRLAISDDGTYLYAALGSQGVIRRYVVKTHAIDLQFSISPFNTVSSMVVLPGQPLSILVGRTQAAFTVQLPDTSADVAVYDGSTARPAIAGIPIDSLYVRADTAAIYGWGGDRIYQFAVGASGVTVQRSLAAPSGFTISRPVWSGHLLADREGIVFNVDTWNFSGMISGGFGPSPNRFCGLAANPSGQSMVAARQDDNFSVAEHASLLQYSLSDFRPSAGDAIDTAADLMAACKSQSVVQTWGADSVAINAYQFNGTSHLVFLHSAGLVPVSLSLPLPQSDPAGVRIPVRTNKLVYDAARNLVWGTVSSDQGLAGNCVISIDPASGRIVNAIYAGSEPYEIALSDDSSRLFVTLRGAPDVQVIDLDTETLIQSFAVADAINYATPASIAAIPGQPGSVAVLRSVQISSHASDAAIYDEGVRRPNVVSNWKDSGQADQFSLMSNLIPSGQPDTIYAFDNDLYYADGTHAFFLLGIDANGIQLKSRLNTLYDTVVYDSERLYEGNGQLLTPDTSALLGQFAASGIPVVFPEIGRVAYVGYAGTGGVSGITLFDSATMIPLDYLSLIPPGVYPPNYPLDAPAAAVRAGADAIAVSTGNDTLIVPLKILPPWPKYAAQMQQVAPGIQSMSLPVNALRSLPGSTKLVFATPSTAGSLGNSIVTFDTSAGRVVQAIPVGSEPSVLATSRDGSIAAASLAGELHVAQVHLDQGAGVNVFAPDPNGLGRQEPIYDLTFIADNGLAASYTGGPVAIFDDGHLRPAVDFNTGGAYAAGANGPTQLRLAGSTDSTLIYGFNTYLSTFEFKRFNAAPDGVHWLSSAAGLLAGFDLELAYSQELVYDSRGNVINPEQSRKVGVYSAAFTQFTHVAPDAANRRVYFASDSAIYVFDMDTYAQLGHLTVSPNGQIMSLVKYSPGGLALHTADGKVYLVDVSAIPQLATPVPSSQPSLPSTPGVRIINITANDIAYDSSRDVLYASRPNSEGAFGDQITAIDPGTGQARASWAAGPEPRLLALSTDQTQLFFASGRVDNYLFSNYSFTSEAVRDLDLNSGAIGSRFAQQAPGTSTSYSIVDMAVLPNQPQSVAVISDLVEDVDTGAGVYRVDHGASGMQVFDAGIPRPNMLTAPDFGCTSVEHGTAANLYCTTGTTFSKLTTSSSGVVTDGSTVLYPTNDAELYGHIVFNDGRLFTSTGLVMDPEAMRVIGHVAAQGPVAVDNGRVYWLDIPSYTQVGSAPVISATLRAFDAATMSPLGAKTILITSLTVPRLVPCGSGRIAFNSGQQLYVVDTRAFVAPPIGSHVASVAAGGGVTISTPGSGSTSVGYASLQGSLGSPALAGFGIFEFRPNGILVTEAAVPASPAIRSGGTFVEMGNGVNTGIAISNPNAQTVRIEYGVVDSTGKNMGGADLFIPPGGQVAAFLDQSPFNIHSPTAFVGAFQFGASLPVTMTALRGFTNERSEFLITTLPVVDIDKPNTSNALHFPHFAEGGGWTTQIVLMNPGGTVLTGTLQFRDPSGALAPLTIDGQTSSSFTYSIPGYSAQRFQSSGAPALVLSGSIAVIPSGQNGSPAGSAIFSYRANGITVTQAGVAANPQGRAFRLYAESTNSGVTGLAIANVSTTAAKVSLELFNLDGTSTGHTGTLNIPANGQIAAFLNQISGFSQLPGSFQGTLRVTSDSAICLIGLGARYNERNDFLIATTPALDETLTPDEPLYFGYIADGGGYTTRFILMNLSPTQPAAGAIQFYTQTGLPWNLAIP